MMVSELEIVRSRAKIVEIKETIEGVRNQAVFPSVGRPLKVIARPSRHFAK